jgi:hypothetical protein
MNINETEKYLIVADKEYSEMLFFFKKKNPLVDIHIVTKGNLLSALSFKQNERKNALTYLLSKQKYDYAQCKKLLHILLVGDYSGHTELEQFYSELKEGEYIYEDTLSKIRVSQRKVLLFEMDEDYELSNFLKRKNIPFEYIHMEDIGREKAFSENRQPEILSFDDKFMQFSYIFSDIRKRILENPKCKDNITLFIEDNQDLFYVNYFSNLFGIDCFTNMRNPVVSDEAVSKALNAFFEKKSFDLDIEAGQNNSLKMLLDDIELYNLKSLDFDFAYSCLIEILSSQEIQFAYKDRGIWIANKLFYDAELYDNRLIYVTNFQFGDFYSESEDDNLFPDDELYGMGVNPSYVNTRMDRQKKLNFVLCHPITFLSRVLLHLDDKIYDSQFLSELNWKASKPVEKYYKDGVYTTKAKEIVESVKKDMEHVTKDDIYRSYDHAFHPFDANYKKEKYSPSDLKAYFDCPFYFYLEKVLKLSKGDIKKDYAKARIGDLIHAVFEDIYSADYSHFDERFEQNFQRGLDACRKDAENAHQEISLEEKMNYRLVKRWLRDIVRTELLKKQNACIVGEVHEKKVELTLNDGSRDYQFGGQLDKIIYTKANGFKYYTLVDYKTGVSGDFVLEQVYFGGSLQLPLYYLSLSSAPTELTDNGTDLFGGFGIEHIYFSKPPVHNPSNSKSDQSPSCYGETSILEKTVLSGITYSSLEYINSFDSTAINTKKNEIKSSGTFLNCRNSFGLDFEKSLLSEKYNYTMAQFILDAKNAAMESVKKIESSSFNITPVSQGKGRQAKCACNYCRYANICYHAKADTRNLDDEIAEHFCMKKETDSDDEETSVEEE